MKRCIRFVAVLLLLGLSILLISAAWTAVADIMGVQWMLNFRSKVAAAVSALGLAVDLLLVLYFGCLFANSSKMTS